MNDLGLGGTEMMTSKKRRRPAHKSRNPDYFDEDGQLSTRRQTTTAANYNSVFDSQ